MELTIRRSPAESGPGYTHGQLLTDEGGFLCWTLEDEDRGLTQDMGLDKILRIKVKGATAIPKGRYKVKLRVSPSLKDRSYAKPYGGRFPYICDVPGFDSVMLHPGNTPADTAGCPLPGMLHSGIRGRIFDSVAAYRDLMDYYVWPTYKRGGPIYITIE